MRDLLRKGSYVRIGDVVKLDGREAVCICEAPLCCKVLGTDRLYAIRKGVLPVIRNISPVVKQAFDSVQAGKMVLVERLLFEVAAVGSQNVELRPAQTLQAAMAALAPAARLGKEAPIWRAIPRISPQYVAEDVAAVVFAKHPVTAFLWQRTLRDSALAWIKAHCPLVLLDAILEAETQTRLAPIHFSQGQLNLGFIRAESPDDLWVIKHATAAFFAWAQEDSDKACASYGDLSVSNRGTLSELFEQQAKHAKWKRELVRTLIAATPTTAKA